MKVAGTNLVVAMLVLCTICGSAGADLTDGLIAHWAFDEESGTIAHDSAGSYHGNIYGAQWVDGQVGGALDFDGVNDYIDTTSANLDLAGTDTITVSAWIFARGQDEVGVIINDYDRNNTYGWTVNLYKDRRFRAVNIDLTKSMKRQSSPLELNTWHHVVAVIYPADYPDIYVNGVLDNNPFASGSATNALYMSSGNVIIGGQTTPADYYFNGAIDDLRVYNRALSASEIRQLYGIELAAIEIVGPGEIAENFSAQYKAIAHYDNNSTADVTNLAEWFVEPNDIASITAGLLTTEMVDLPTEVTITTQYGEGEVVKTAEKQVSILTICPSGSALDFDGVDDYVETTTLGDIDEPVTISLWMKVSELNQLQSIFGRNKNIGGEYYYENFLYIGGDTLDRLRFGDKAGGGSSAFIYSNTLIEADVWYHVAVTRNSENYINFYLNGVWDGGGSTINVDNTGINYRISTINTGHYPFNGIIDDLRVYNRALSAEEIQASMHISPDTDDPSLVAYWDFDEGEGQVASDSAGGNDGTLGSTPDVDSSDPEWVVSGAPVGICSPVAIDIKPGSCPNPLNLASRGILPVAILGSEDFDVNTIDSGSIFLEGVSTVRTNYEDVAAPVSDGNECTCITVGPDGYPDLTLKFYTQDVVTSLLLSEDELAEGQVLKLTLNGELYDGMGIQGTDCVVLVGNVSKWLAAQKWDANGDGIVNMADFAELANYWLESH